MTSIPTTIPFILGGSTSTPPPPAPVIAPVVPFTSVDRLTPGQLRFFHAGLCRSHKRRISVDVLHRDGSNAGSLGLSTMDGSVVGTHPGPDTVSRVLSLNVVDEDRVLDFSPSSPGENVYFDRMLRVHDERLIPDLGWVSTVVHTGPVWAFKRNGSEVSLTAHSEERLAMGSLWTPLTLHRGEHKVDAIRRLLERTGATRFNFPRLPERGHKIGERHSLDRFASPYSHAWKIARSMGRMLYTDARGVWQMPLLSSKTIFRFEGGDGGSVMSDPEVNRDLSNYRNTWLVLGKKPKGAKDRARAVVKIPPEHELSARAFRRNGQPWVVAEKIEDTSLRSDRECERVGQQHMSETIIGTVEASFSAAPIPDLELGDLCDLVLPEGAVTFRLWEFTLPLVGDSMSVGRVKRSPRRRGRRG